MKLDKAEGLFKLKLNGIMTPFKMYGLQDYIPATINQIVDAAKEFHDNISRSQPNNSE
ncbi:unnamed protein product [marine sediment metagenome]|uniref:Uncharacterized protein n=1 Tax=marine sediment metagenome TaxID=412755 RepID=X0X1J3_9ZZZZ